MLQERLKYSNHQEKPLSFYTSSNFPQSMSHNFKSESSKHAQNAKKIDKIISMMQKVQINEP